MRRVLVLLFFFTGSSYSNKYYMENMTSRPDTKKYYYLALGDSYSIGERVQPSENFPSQVSGMMMNAGVDFQPPRIIAKTGWTTDELEAGIREADQSDALRSSYDFVTLLIGVNNQYRGRPAHNYKIEFEELLKKAIHFAGDRAERVVVLSIPDWGVTPLAAGGDKSRIGKEIDGYNAINKELAQQYHVYYIDITPWTREAASDLSLLANDGLHPSGKEYKRWAESISAIIKSKI